MKTSHKFFICMIIILCIALIVFPIQIFNWILYGRESYWGSHWSSEGLLVLAGLVIFYKMLVIRWHERRGTKSKWILRLLLFLAVDGFFSMYFPGSLHETIFEPTFVLSTMFHNTVSFQIYALHWAQDINQWRSYTELWAITVFLGYLWLRKYLRFNLKWWMPFIVTLAFWLAIGLPVSLPFPDFKTYPFYCHDCLTNNLMEFLYNLTFAPGIVSSIRGSLPIKRLKKERIVIATNG